MTSGIDPQELNRPLSVGDIVSIGFRMYTQNFKPYFIEAFRASLWQLLILVGLIPLFVGAAFENVGIIALSIPIAIAAYVYGVAKAIAGQSVINRLALQELMGQPEPIPDARRYCRARTWRFFFASLLLGLIIGAGVIVMLIPFVVMLGVIGAIAGSSSSGDFSQAFENNGAVVGVIILLMVLLGLGLTILTCWLSGRLAVMLMPIVSDPEMLSAQSLGQAWKLTQGHGWRIFLVLLLVGLLMIPVIIAVQIISVIVQIPLIFLVATAAQSNSALGALVQVVSQLVSYVIGILVGTLTIPFTQSMISVIYFDLRNRKEGTGLSLRDTAGDSL
jgi:hypothetical protein